MLSALIRVQKLRRKYPEGVPGDDQVFVGGDDSHCARTLPGRSRICVCRISSFVEQDAEMSQSTADAQADRRGLLADAAGEDEGIESAERRGHCADALAYVITEPRALRTYS